MRRILFATSIIGFLAQAPAVQAQQSLLDAAMAAAMARFESAWPRLQATLFGVDTTAYRDAISLGRFQSAHWGQAIRVDLVTSDQAGGDCARFAAYTRLPPADGVVSLVLCPQFFTPGADALRELTILHEMVHVVAGRDECQAMAFAAHVEQLTRGVFTPVNAYWQANGCQQSAYRLP